MNDLWTRLARCARRVPVDEEQMAPGFDAAVLRRLARESAHATSDDIESWLPLLRPALGLAFATALVCVLLQTRAPQETSSNLLVETDRIIQLAILK